MGAGYAVRYPDAAAEALFSGFLAALPADRRQAVIDAILSLEDDRRPTARKGLGYLETDPERMQLFLREMPGVPFKKRTTDIVSDCLYARHRIVTEDVVVVYAIDDAKKIVWLMGIRAANA